MIAILPSASATKGRKKSAVEKKEIVVAHMANKRQIPEKEKNTECKHGNSMSLLSPLLEIRFEIYKHHVSIFSTIKHVVSFTNTQCYILHVKYRIRTSFLVSLMELINTKMADIF